MPPNDRTDRELDKLLRAPSLPVNDRLDIPAPTGWERGREVSGDTGTGSTGAIDMRALAHVDDIEAWLLQRAGYDPEQWIIVGDHNYREWDANVGGGQIRTLQYRKFNVRRKGTDGLMSELMAIIENDRPRKFDWTVPGTPVFGTGDWQLGKIDGDGTSGSVGRVRAGMDEAHGLLCERGDLWDEGLAWERLHIAFMGDCGEYFVSQDGRNAWRTDLTIAEQLRLTRRLMLETVRKLAPLAKEVSVVAVPGNHDQTSRAPLTLHGDSFDTECLVAVSEILAESEAYQHVNCYVPRRDEKTLVLDVNGTGILHLHGEDVPANRHFEWWEGQAFEPGAEAHAAQVMLMAHHHHHMIDTRGQRMVVMTPSTESQSTWWKNKKGHHGAPGSLLFYVDGGRARDFRIVGREPVRMDV